MGFDEQHLFEKDTPIDKKNTIEERKTTLILFNKFFIIYYKYINLLNNLQKRLKY